MTKWCVKDDVSKMVCDKVVYAKDGVKDGVLKMVCERWCVTKWCERWCVTKLCAKDGV